MLSYKYPDTVSAHCARIIIDVMDAEAKSSNIDPDPSALHGRICASFDAVIQSCRTRRLPDNAALELLYPLAALADEVIVSVPRYRQYWSDYPLQLRYFGETAAGTGFFTRLESLVAAWDGETAWRRRPLELYFISLALGFKGMYGGGDARRLRGVAERLGVLLAEAQLKERGRRSNARGQLLINEKGIMKIMGSIPKVAMYLGIASLLLTVTAAAAFMFASAELTEFLGRFL